ncbi:hypothetical protein GGI42DRAFT_348566 [Trichoderma sp. SZMC 28013]
MPLTAARPTEDQATTSSSAQSTFGLRQRPLQPQELPMMGVVFGSGPSGMALPAAATLRAGRLDLISLLCQSVVPSPHARPRGTPKRLVQSLSHIFILTRHVNILLAPSPSPHLLNLHHDVTEDTEK